jgi:hypothetical protein
MELIAIFECWYVPDGNYPPLREGQLVNLSFELQPSVLELVEPEAGLRLDSTGHAEYRFTAKVLGTFAGLVAVDTGSFKCYLTDTADISVTAGQVLTGHGTLAVDHYAWVEQFASASVLDRIPDLFYTLRVSEIQKVRVRERFIQRREDGKTFPTRVAASDLESGDVERIATMDGQPFDEEFYIVAFSDEALRGRAVARTFR